MTDAGVAVCIASGGACELRARTFESVRAHTEADVPVREIAPGENPLAGAALADIVVIAPGCLVAEGWLEGLREAALAGSTTASATAVTQHDLDDWTAGDAFDPASAAVKAGSLKLRPRIAGGEAACVYVRQSAVELVGAGGDFGRRCVERGLSHVLADDVLVLDPRPASMSTAKQDLAENPTGSLARALGAARRALRGLSVTIDARILTGPTTGTHVHVLEVIAGLARLDRVRLTAIVPNRPSRDALARLQALPTVSLVTYEEASRAAGEPKADIVHRPFQLSNAGDLPFLASLGDRLLLTQQDLIAYHNPAYFPTRADWAEYRELTRIALAAADRVLFFSAHTRDDALGEDLVAPAGASVVPLGVDHPHSQATAPPGGARQLQSTRPVMLCLGSDFHHKNRVFALRILAALRKRHDWDGMLVFAGPTVAFGSSRQNESRLLADQPELGEAVLDVGAVSEAEKHWLFERSSLGVYPSVLEGFGLVPFEAAAHRVPCLWAPGSSLSELLPDDAAEIVPWDEEQTALRALNLLRDPAARERNLQAINAAAAGLTWDATAARLLDAYEATANAPTRDTQAALLGEDAARLVGPGGELPTDVHRPLLALTTHRRIAKPVFGALKLGYRMSYEIRRARRRQRPQRRK